MEVHEGASATRVRGGRDEYGAREMMAVPGAAPGLVVKDVIADAFLQQILTVPRSKASSPP